MPLLALSFGLLWLGYAYDVDLTLDWNTPLRNVSTAATVEVDVMPFLARTTFGGSFDAYYEALSNLGADFVRFSPWFANPRYADYFISRMYCSHIGFVVQVYCVAAYARELHER